MFKNLFGGGEPPAPRQRLASPWSTGVSWYDQVAAAIVRRGGRDEPLDLGLNGDMASTGPDHLPGAEDYAQTNPSKSPRDPRVQGLLRALAQLVQRPSDQAFAEFYRLARQPETINLADPLRWSCRELIAHFDAIGSVARRIAREAPDAGPVKIALSLLGAFGHQERDRDLIFTLGAYDEFTVYAVDAVRLSEGAETKVFELVKGVQGWGRVFAIHSLQNVKDPAIRDWMLREGHDNGIGAPDAAGCCAREGDLLAALQRPDLDDGMMQAAGALIRKMLLLTPERGLIEYPQSAEACVAWLERVGAWQGVGLAEAHVASELKALVNEQRAPWKELEACGWTPARREQAARLSSAFLARPEWPDRVRRELEANEPEEMFAAANLADALGLDAWSILMAAAPKRDYPSWTLLVIKAKGREQLDQVLDLARQRLDLEKVGSGATSRETYGEGYEDDEELTLIVQELFRHPGQGWPLIDVALRGRVARLRFVALYTLGRTDPKLWPAQARPALQQAMQNEPDAALRADMGKLLKMK